MSATVEDLWDAIYELGTAADALPLNKHPGLWSIALDDAWELKANAHKEAVEGIPAFTLAVWFNGWPAGLIDPGGCTLAAGLLANIDTLHEAMKRKVAALKDGQCP